MKSEFFYCSVFKAPTYRSGANSTNISGGDPYFLWPPPKKWTKSNNFRFLICSKNISPQIHKKNHKIYTTISYKAGAHLGGGQWWQGPTLAWLKGEMGACLRSLQQWSIYSSQNNEFSWSQKYYLTNFHPTYNKYHLTFIFIVEIYMPSTLKANSNITNYNIFQYKLSFFLFLSPKLKKISPKLFF